MSIPANYEKIIVTSSDASIRVDIPWAFASGELVVHLQDEATGEIVGEETGQFNAIAGEDETGKYVTVSNPFGAVSVIVSRHTTRSQTYELANSEPLNPTALIQALDDTVKIAQEISSDNEDNSADIATNTDNIAINATDIAANTSSINDVRGELHTELSLLDTNDIDEVPNKRYVNAIAFDNVHTNWPTIIPAHTSDIATNTAAIAANSTAINDNFGEMHSLIGDLDTNDIAEVPNKLYVNAIDFDNIRNNWPSKIPAIESDVAANTADVARHDVAIDANLDAFNAEKLYTENKRAVLQDNIDNEKSRIDVQINRIDTLEELEGDFQSWQDRVDLISDTTVRRVFYDPDNYEFADWSAFEDHSDSNSDNFQRWYAAKIGTKHYLALYEGDGSSFVQLSARETPDGFPIFSMYDKKHYYFELDLGAPFWRQEEDTALANRVTALENAPATPAVDPPRTITLTGPLVYTPVTSGNSEIVEFVQDATGGHTVDLSAVSFGSAQVDFVDEGADKISLMTVVKNSSGVWRCQNGIEWGY